MNEEPQRRPRGWAPRLTLGAVALTVAGRVAMAATEDYATEIQKWRTDREARLKSDEGWLTVAGLFWLKDGSNRFGADPGNDIVLPAGSAPARAGTFELAAGQTTVQVEPGVEVTCEGKPVARLALRSDAAGAAPDVLKLGSLSLFVIERGGRYAIRLRDRNSRMRQQFTGLRWFPVKASYRVAARYVSYPSLRPVVVPNILGSTEKMPSPGYALFDLDGKEVRLEGVLEEPHATQLFFIFKDATSGKETYPAGRFLYSDLPKNGAVVLDFNRAYNPPCAFTPFATCPLPPEQNRLPMRIEAGELRYGNH
jgi:uncharacterized protein (DUF1684 family)